MKIQLKRNVMKFDEFTRMMVNWIRTQGIHTQGLYNSVHKLCVTFWRIPNIRESADKRAGTHGWSGHTATNWRDTSKASSEVQSFEQCAFRWMNNEEFGPVLEQTLSKADQAKHSPVNLFASELFTDQLMPICGYHILLVWSHPWSHLWSHLLLRKAGSFLENLNCFCRFM